MHVAEAMVPKVDCNMGFPFIEKERFLNFMVVEGCRRDWWETMREGEESGGGAEFMVLGKDGVVRVG